MTINKKQRRVRSRNEQDAFNAVTSQVDLYHIKTLFEETFVDHSFQRKGGFEGQSGWTEELSRVYMKELLSGCTFNRIMVADAAKCLEYSQSCDDVRSVEYFENILDMGKRYVSIDGNNTTSTINHYANNKLKVGGKLLTDIGSKMDQLKHLMSYEVEVIILQEILLDEMTTQFRRLNTSSALNPQEYRQARISPLSNFIRERAAKKPFEDMLLRLGVFKESSFDKRHHEEFFAQLLLYLVKPDNVHKRHALDRLYEEMDEIPSDHKKHLIDLTATLIDFFAGQKPVKKGVFTKGKFYSAMILLDNLNYRGHKILNCDALRDWFLKQDTEWIADDACITIGDQEEKSYPYWCKFYTNPHSRERLTEKWQGRLDAEIEELQRKKILASPIKRPTYFTPKQLLLLCAKQDWETRKGEEIPPSEAIAINGGIHGDHVRSVKEGGETTIENGEAMFALDNLRKSSKSNAPHFEHQR